MTKEIVLLMDSFIYVVLMFNLIMGLTGIDFSEWMDGMRDGWINGWMDNQ